MTVVIKKDNLLPFLDVFIIQHFETRFQQNTLTDIQVQKKYFLKICILSISLPLHIIESENNFFKAHHKTQFHLL